MAKFVCDFDGMNSVIQALNYYSFGCQTYLKNYKANIIDKAAQDNEWHSNSEAAFVSSLSEKMATLESNFANIYKIQEALNNALKRIEDTEEDLSNIKI